MATSSILSISSICFIMIFLSTLVESKRYDNMRSVRIKISNEFQLEAIQNMNLDVWRGLTIGYNDVMMSDDDIVQCWNYNTPTEILIFNIKNCMEREAEEGKLDFGSANTGDDWFGSYHTYEEMVGLMDMIAADHPQLVKFTASIGTTYEGRDIPVVTITPPTNTRKINITVIGGMEARAWNAPTTVLFIFKKLVDLYYTDKNVTDLLDKLSISFIPITNPDGYEYSRTTDRLWKKNRRQFSNGQYGVDLNRNFDDHWGLSCGNSTAASGEYCGPSPNSENETIAIRDFILSHGPFAGGVYYTSYGQSILRPYGWTNAVPTRDPLLKSIANQWSAKIKEVNGNEYTSKTAYEEFSISGTVYDWMFSHANVSFPYSVQLGDDGRYGYLIPSSQILRIALENLKGFEYFCQSVSAWEE